MKTTKILKAFCVLFVLGFAVALCSCSSKSSKTEIMIYSCAEDYRNEFYLSELQKKFPEYSFTLDYQSSGGAAAKLSAEGEKTAGDILLSWDYTYFGMLTDYLADLSYFDDSIILDDMIVPSKRFIGEYRNSGCIVVNTEVLAERGLAEPTSYADLLRPEYKDLLSMPSPKSSGTGYMFLRNLVNEWGEDAAFDYFDAFAKNVLQFTSSGSGPINSLIQKEVAVALGMTGQAVMLINEGYPLKIIFFAEGAPYSLYGHAMTKKAEKRADYDKLKEVFNYLETVVTPACDELYFPEPVFKTIDFKLPANYPQNINYGNMNDNTSTEKTRLLEKWKY